MFNFFFCYSGPFSCCLFLWRHFFSAAVKDIFKVVCFPFIFIPAKEFTWNFRMKDIWESVKIKWNTFQGQIKNFQKRATLILKISNNNEGSHNHQFLLLTQQYKCLVTVSWKTPNIVLKSSKFTKNGIIWK